MEHKKAIKELLEDYFENKYFDGTKAKFYDIVKDIVLDYAKKNVFNHENVTLNFKT